MFCIYSKSIFVCFWKGFNTITCTSQKIYLKVAMMSVMKHLEKENSRFTHFIRTLKLCLINYIIIIVNKLNLCWEHIIRHTCMTQWIWTCRQDN